MQKQTTLVSIKFLWLKYLFLTKIIILQEDEYKANSQNIFKELENKLDRLELDSLKDQIEKQLKKLRKIQVIIKIYL